MNRKIPLALFAATLTSACTFNLPNLTGITGTVKAAGQPQQGGQQPSQPNGGPVDPCLPGRQLAATTGTSKPEATTPTLGEGVPDLYKRIYGAYAITLAGDNVVIKTHGEPDHDSPYYQGNGYVADTQAGFKQNPNMIVGQDLTFTLPLHPAEDASHAATPGGPTGIALDGVPYFNQYSGEGNPLASELVSFDQFAGHPNQDGQYHYHVEPVYLTGKYGKEAFLGFMLDGFPVYGPVEDGKTLSSKDLDTYHGHFAVTEEFPQGVYHYHITADAPYITGTGFYGKAGTVVDPSRKGPGNGGQPQTGQPPQQVQMPQNPCGTAGGQQQMPSPPGGMPQGGQPQTNTGTQPPPPGGQTNMGTQQPPGGTQPPPPPGGQQQGGTQPPPPSGTQPPPPGGQQQGGTQPPPPGGRQQGATQPPPPPPRI